MSQETNVLIFVLDLILHKSHCHLLFLYFFKCVPCIVFHVCLQETRYYQSTKILKYVWDSLSVFLFLSFSLSLFTSLFTSLSPQYK